MNITFKHTQLKILNNLTSDLKQNIEQCHTLSDALNKTIIKYRLLPHNIGRCKLETESNCRTCSICNTFVTKGSCVRKLKTCRHEFHKKCIDNWLVENEQNCYICNKKCVLICEQTNN